MKQVLIIAGEASGDLHAAELIHSSLAIDPELRFFGIGGEKMRNAGAEIIIDNKQLAVIGIIELITHFKIIRAAFRKIASLLKTSPPDLVIFVDYPEFNLRMAKISKKYNIKSLYFICPQIWAWKQWRIKTIKRCVDTLALIFPFEVDFYRKHNVKACYVGNPLVHAVKPGLSKELVYSSFGLDPGKTIIALLPGSRQSELKFMFDTLLQTAKIIKQKIPDVQFVIPLVIHFSKDQLQAKIDPYQLNIKLISNHLYDVLSVSHAAISVSGTVTLEVALMGTPFVIFYKLNRLTYWIGRMMVKIDMIGLCNIVARKKIAQEFIQDNATPENLASEALRLLNDKPYREAQLQGFSNLRNEFLQYPAEDIGQVVTEALKLPAGA